MWKKIEEEAKRRLEVEELKKELEKQQLTQQANAYVGGRSAGKSATALQAQLASQVFGKGIPTFESRRGSAADGVVDDVISKLKAGDYQ